MRILISCIPYDGGKSGISVYIDNIVRELSQARHDLTLLIDSVDAEHFSSYPVITVPRWAATPLFSMLYHLIIVPFLIRGGKYDFCILSAANRRAFCYYPIYTIAVVHDLSQYHVKAKYSWVRMFYIMKVLPFFVRRAHAIAAISGSTRQDLERYWHIASEKISVVYNGLSLPHPGRYSADEGVEWRKKNGINRPYILYISRLEHPGKNHCGLIAGFERLPAELSRKYDLVLAGASWSGVEEIYAAAERSPLRDHIHFTGYIAPEELPSVYRNAACYIFPSYFEGFGLSLIEAMYYGIPCGCSSTSSLGEIGGGGAALLFDPSSPDEIATVIESLLTSSAERSRLIEHGKRRAAEFSWVESAAGLVEIFRRGQKKGGVVFGVPFQICSMSDAVTAVGDSVTIGRCRGYSTFAAFINAHYLNLAYSDKDYASALCSADWVFPDGAGVALACKILSLPTPDNVNGTDMFPLLARKRYRFYLLGGAPGVAEQAAKRASERYPDAEFAGWHDGFFGEEEEPDIIKAINLASPDILLVALGGGKQEKWIIAHQRELFCGVAIGVGGLFDFVSERIPRAPGWMRRCRMEWLFRLYCEPRRLCRRYLIGNWVFIWRVLQERYSRRGPAVR